MEEQKRKEIERKREIENPNSQSPMIKYTIKYIYFEYII